MKISKTELRISNRLFKLLLFFMIGFSFNVFSQQEEDAWVYFNDKPNSSEGINNPILILTQKAINRKQKHNVAIDFRDVPVDEGYIIEVKAQTGITVFAKSKWFNSIHVRGTEANIKDLLNLSIVSEIIFANRNLNFTIDGTDPSTKLNKVTNKFQRDNEKRLTEFQYGFSANQIEMIKGDYLHLQDYTGEGMTIAVLDTSFPNVDTIDGFSRLRDSGKLLGTYDFVNRQDDVFSNEGYFHGTAVLACMTGHIEDRYVGTAPDASYYLFRSEDIESESPVEESYWVEAVERADSLGVDLINTSLGYKDYDNPNYSYSANDFNGDTAFITKGANIAFEKGLLLVTATGNSGASGLGVPADAPGVLTVGGVDKDGSYWESSSVGSTVQSTQKPDVVAQAKSSFIINPDNQIRPSNGTSFSTPTLTGSIACLWQALPNLNNSEIMDLVRMSSSQFNSPDFELGFGIPNFELALNGQLSTEDVGNLSTLQVFPNPASSIINISIPENTGLVKLQLLDVLGKKIQVHVLSKNNNTLDLSNLSKGVYIMQFNTDAFSVIKKILIK